MSNAPRDTLAGVLEALKELEKLLGDVEKQVVEAEKKLYPRSYDYLFPKDEEK